jgi:hypothetical protein
VYEATLYLSKAMRTATTFFFLSALLLVLSYITMQGCDTAEPEATGLTLPPEGLLAYYPFDGNVQDASGAGNHGTVSGAVLTADPLSVANQAYVFDGIDDYIDIGNSSTLKPSLPLTLTLWVRVDEQKGSALFTNNYDLDVNNGAWLALSSNGTVAVAYGNGGAIGRESRWTRHSTTVLDPGRWYHVAGVIYNEDILDVYINGVIEDGDYSGTPTERLLHYSAGPGNFGRRDSGVATDPIYFKGALDEFILYDRALSAEEIMRIYFYKAGTP